ncbi:MAG TPA: alpha-1,4-glucan--maltose-1-phosphate maltosyltransferase [Gaiellaceae bacterium]|jgi:starch synthase (maltosyl-transferring)|nr:alpha-1,4-glucan--maltose-1-phosphate maltosyltransferase [Gaiellaceae bacterium]
MPSLKTKEPPRRIQIQDVLPRVDCGRYAPKRTLGERLEVSGRVFRDGHEILGAAVRARPKGERRWRETLMYHAGNDRWVGHVDLDRCGRWEFAVGAWVDRFASWRHEVRRKVDAGQEDLSSELSEGAALYGVDTLTVEEALAHTESDRSEFTSTPSFEVDVDRERATFGSWYELFPRSWGGFAGVERVLPELAELGFDVVYLPPVHPIGRTNRKGRNNALEAGRGDPGSPWAIGSEEGGHDAVHPELGTLAEFESMVARGRELGCEICLDFAIQCSPDHPWLAEHPEWFHRRPDGTLKYAENPPKKYQDIYNVNFDSEDWQGLWEALRDVVQTWVDRGVRVFRVDNPHTKPVPFWEWLIAEIRAKDPEVLFLAEAFTRPAMMQTLGKAGFAQSYTYFTWKNTKGELTEFLGDLLEWAPYYRPNFFANTPDILHEYLQHGGRPAFEARLVLAATLSPTYGIYSGYEHCENVPVRPGSEEYLDSEKYEAKERRLDGPLLPLVRRLNEIRRENPALQRLDGLTFVETENDLLLGYAKRRGDNAVLCVVNLDPHAAQEGLAVVPASLGFPPAFRVRDLLSGDAYTWTIGRNYVRLGPGQSHVFGIGE